MVAAALIVATALALPVAQAQEGLGAVLMKQDLSVAGREVIQVLVEFAPGVEFPRHSHPGEELVYVVEGVLEMRLRVGRRGRLPRPAMCCSSHTERSTR